MFTGLVEGTGEVKALRKSAGGAVLTLRAGEAARGAAIGDSIAVDGACLTVTRVEGDALSFDLSAETLRSTTLGGLSPGDRVNLETSLRADGKLGGHFVTGHVDGVGRIRARAARGGAFELEIEAPPAVLDYLVPKGSVALDGMSLTVVEVRRETFTVVIIPHTSQVTTIGGKGPGSRVNLEADIIGKYVARFLQRSSGGDGGLMRALGEGGFLGG
ncbi:MAG: riboflavin synthase [Thermodesulfovibrionales bacterium]